MGASHEVNMSLGTRLHTHTHTHIYTLTHTHIYTASIRTFNYVFMYTSE